MYTITEVVFSDVTKHIQSWEQNNVGSIIPMQLSKMRGLTHEGAGVGDMLEAKHVAPNGAEP